MPRVPFEEKTNEERVREGIAKEKKKSERESIVEYLQMVSKRTRDYNMRYDISLCIEILEGKENQRVSELREAVADLVAENECLTKRCNSLEQTHTKHTNYNNHNHINTDEKYSITKDSITKENNRGSDKCGVDKKI